ncbi:MAG: hypothetical protein A2X94_14110 [Bdellovibrionales bacterium GWB1_55_8]|nr:MAG: hypothetical protein A2X94_14110 [Bdellovibrionales bacterium GWB1_55_8]
MMRLLLGRMYSLIVLFFLFALIWAYSPHVRADETFTFVVKKQEEKAKNRWTLSEWLETRDRMRLMDLWLALHSPSPYEFLAGAAYIAPQTGAASSGMGFSGAAYASIFGVGGDYEPASASRAARWDAQFLFRIFGYHAQGTNLTLQAGVRGGEEGQRGAIAGISANFYLARHFGLEGLYRHHFESIPNAAGNRVQGSRYEGGAFIDFSFLRLFGNYFSEQERRSGETFDGVTTGLQLGAKLFF